MLTSGERLNSESRFIGVDAVVVDYWEFVLGDPRTNNARGYLAEFLVAKALGLEASGRVEWAEHDLLYRTTRIEVKSTGTVQTWASGTAGRSAPVFSGLMGKLLDDEGAYAPTSSLNSDLYIFAIETEDNPLLYNPLNIGQWRFIVVPVADLIKLNQKSIRLPVLRTHKYPELEWAELADAVAAAAATRRVGEPTVSTPTASTGTRTLKALL